MLTSRWLSPPCRKAGVMSRHHCPACMSALACRVASGTSTGGGESHGCAAMSNLPLILQAVKHGGSCSCCSCCSRSRRWQAAMVAVASASAWPGTRAGRHACLDAPDGDQVVCERLQAKHEHVGHQQHVGHLRDTMADSDSSLRIRWSGQRSSRVGAHTGSSATEQEENNRPLETQESRG